ncbi:hypothetical protein AGDE_16881 [Angomonas deanei]|uniref:RNase H type-1 domain-containing protein n=1 Tax=Angomonas deanei TaxID=59799 RepID=A0A7G2C4S5_9TRYP|nr:hypothetical protein AGDE_16881 [Angomonas deanei]CAD2214726.1 hypothetical protein, conserved [Angomonas deanei]|eukprot:EPY15984.1 hypothetical protein AGDE_16881 [Angomonas deanei]
MSVMRCMPLSVTLKRLAIRWSCRRRCLPDLKMTFHCLHTPVFRLPDIPQTAALPHIQLIEYHFNPLEILKLDCKSTVIPLTLALTHPPLSADAIQFVSLPIDYTEDMDETKKNELKLAANYEIYRKAIDCCSDSYIIEAWSDGSVDLENGTAGGAGLLFDTRVSECDTNIPIKAYSFSSPLHSCSFTSECFAILGLLTELYNYILSHVEETLSICVFSDSLSMLSSVGKGLCCAGTISQLLWRSLLRLISLPNVSRIVCSHVYAHCNFPRGDVIDAHAKEARQPLSTDNIWHSDLARSEWNKVRDTWQSTVVPSDFRRRISGKNDFVMDGKLPLKLTVKQSRLLLQLRTG